MTQAETSVTALRGMEEHSISPVPLTPFQCNTEPWNHSLREMIGVLLLAILKSWAEERDKRPKRRKDKIFQLSSRVELVGWFHVGGLSFSRTQSDGSFQTKGMTIGSSSLLHVPQVLHLCKGKKRHNKSNHRFPTLSGILHRNCSPSQHNWLIPLLKTGTVLFWGGVSLRNYWLLRTRSQQGRAEIPLKKIIALGGPNLFLHAFSRSLLASSLSSLCCLILR